MAAGIRYTMLDDSHFKNAGLSAEQLHGYYLTEDEGNLLAVFPDSEPLRYLMPFGGAHQVIEHLAELAHKHTNAIAVFGDDGEKFGAWPETKRSVYEEGWLTRFFDLLVENRGWIQCVTPTEALESTPPLGKVYLPEGSYREMTEWVLPADQMCEFAHVRREFEHDARWPKLARFVRGGFWRNFKVKYPETNEMYARMMQVSRRLQKLTESGVTGELMDHARSCLYRGQCNCSYWHGAFGGTYLPHLRNAVYQQLIAADNLLDRASGRGGPFVEATADDFNFDGRQEIQLANNRLLTLIAPSRGGQMYELDVRSICHNLLATMTRRPEAYHRSIIGGANGRSDVAGVADRVIFKQPGLDQHLQYDGWPRKSLLDHFYDPGVGLAAVSHGDAAERGDFLNRPYEARLRRNPDRIQAQLSAQGVAGGEPVRMTKAVTLEENSPTLEITYLLEGLRRPTATLRRGIQFRGPALGRRRSLFPRRRWTAARSAWRSARPVGGARARLGRRMARHRLRSDDLAAERYLDLSDRNREPIGRWIRTGASKRGGRTALARGARRRWPLEREHDLVARHEPGRTAARATR